MVALKVLPPDLTRDATRLARFRQEARVASALNHPNVCTIHALGETPDGQQFIAMEHIAGQTLRQRLAVRQVPLSEALHIAVQVASALTAAHTAGIVHRDLKPENVMLRPDGFAKVVDFGLAKLAPLADAGATHTGVRSDAGTVVGTVAYMSPEQARTQEVDSRTDVWSLGVMLYEIVAGRSPFVGQSSSDVLAAILDREPAPLARFDPDVPGELQRIVSKALRKDREQRYQGMKDLLLDVEALRDGRQLRQGARAVDDLPPPAVASAIAPQSSAEYVVTQLTTHKVRTALIACALTLMVVGAWWAARGRPEGDGIIRNIAPVQRNLTRLTVGPGLQTDVTWSPDSRFIAYASDQAGNFDIWVQPVSGGNAVAVTRSPAQDRQLTWSPNGSTIVFRSERDGGGLYVVPALGGQEHRLTSFGVRPKWTQDGLHVLFASTDLGVGAVPKLYMVGLDGRPPQQILSTFTDGLLGMAAWRCTPTGAAYPLLPHP